MPESVVKRNEALQPLAVETSSIVRPIIYWLAVFTSLFHLYVNSFGTISEFWRNSFHLGLLGSIGFLLYSLKPTSKALWSSIVDFVLSSLILLTSVYFIAAENALIERNLELTLVDCIVGVVAIVLTLELARRTSGIVIPLLGTFFLSYVLWWGKFIDGSFYFRGLRLNRLLYRMCFSDQGLFGTTTSISSTSVFMFVLFASFLLTSGGTDYIIKLAKAVTGKVAGSSGLVAVVASGLMGTVSGSAIANTVSTGSITIPMMKRTGFQAEFAAGVETAASVGGQLMPPVMGAGAFIMSQWTGLPYQTIITVAFLPAIMYFATVGFYVWLNARKNQLEATNVEALNSSFKIGREGITFILPIAILVGLLIWGYTPTYAAGYSILATIVSSWIGDRPMKLKNILDALAMGAKNMVVTGVLLIAAGLIIGTIATTGMSITLSQLLIDWSGGNLFLAIVSIALASLLLGMGLPVTAAYIMLAVLAAPALENMGISLLSAHLIIFWLSQDSNVTPPVCLAAYAAAGIAQTSPYKTAISAWKLAKGLYIMPLLFAYTALIDGSWGERLLVFCFGSIGLFILTAAVSGYFWRILSWKSRTFLFLISLLIFWFVRLI